MKLFYDDITGKIYYTIYDRDLFVFTYSTNIPLNTLEIDEVAPHNKELCKDLREKNNAVDINGDSKYYISAGELYVRDNWEEHIEDMI